jgi:hypothetical protein
VIESKALVVCAKCAGNWKVKEKAAVQELSIVERWADE